MIDTSPLYNPRTHRYKGVYKGPGPNQWDAIVQTIEGKLRRLGRHTNPEEAARDVATYYENVYGEDWAEIVKNRMDRSWRIRRNTRYPYMAALHKGPRVVCYIAMVRLSQRDKTWKQVKPEDIRIIEDLYPGTTALAMWDKEGDGWISTTAALIAIRVFRAIAVPSQSIAAHES